MKWFSILCLLLFCAAGAHAQTWPNEPGGSTLISEWDMSDASSGGGLQIPGSPACGAFNPGWWSTAVETVESDATAPASPPDIYEAFYPQGYLEGTAPMRTYCILPSSLRRIYVGFYWKTDTPFDLGPNGNKIAFIFNGGGGAGGQQFIIVMPNGNLRVVTEQYPGLPASNPLNPNINATVVTHGVWHRIEWLSDVDTGELKWWLDGVLQGSYTGITNTFNFDEFQFSPTFGGNSGYQKNQDDYYWFDHVRLSIAGTGATDTESPTDPSSLTAAAVSASQINLSWTGSTDNVGVTTYHIERCSGAACSNFAEVDTVIGTPPTTSYTDTGLAASTLYRYQVRASDAAVNLSGYSNIAEDTTEAPPAFIATNYPQDIGIENDPAVVFVERFDDAVASVSTRWGDTNNAGAMALDSTDIPPNSPSGSSITMTLVGGTSSATGFFHEFSPGYDDTLYVRWYQKHPVTTSRSHHGVWVGGYNPSVSFPNPQAGTCLTGNERISMGVELFVESGNRWEHYDYWRGMHESSPGVCFGNDLLNDATATGTTDEWYCVEQMVKLNTPTTASNGEHAFWINEQLISHLGEGFPTGTWAGDSFTQNGGTAFEGFQFRTDTALNLNWIWLQHFNANYPNGQSFTMKYDHVVVATSRIGCIAPASGGGPGGAGVLAGRIILQ